MWVSKLNCIIWSRLCLSRLESPVVQVNLRKLHRKVPVKPTVVCLKTLKHYSPTVAEGKTLVLFFCYSVQSIHCCRRLGQKFCFLQRWVTCTLELTIQVVGPFHWILTFTPDVLISQRLVIIVNILGWDSVLKQTENLTRYL